MNAIFALPHWRDRRYLQASIHLSYALISRYVFNFESSIWNLVITLGTCLVLDTLMSRLFYSRPNNILTSMVIAFGCSIMIYSPSPWPYVGAVSVAVLAKAFIKFEGRHVFNPSNIGVVTILALFPNWAVTSGNLFSGYWGPAILFFILGTINVWWAKQATLAFTWLVAFTLFNFIRGIITDSPFSLGLLILNPLTLIFTFHMITDPATTPKTPWFRFAFAVTVALCDAIMRYYSIVGSQFFALFLITCFMPFVRVIERKYFLTPQAASAASIPVPEASLSLPHRPG
jgi:Na+-translocating ferredoxin:NAD+ oxidoreductase RnfD subunit